MRFRQASVSNSTIILHGIILSESENGDITMMNLRSNDKGTIAMKAFEQYEYIMKHHCVASKLASSFSYGIKFCSLFQTVCSLCLERCMRKWRRMTWKAILSRLEALAVSTACYAMLHSYPLKKREPLIALGNYREGGGGNFCVHSTPCPLQDSSATTMALKKSTKQ